MLSPDSVTNNFVGLGKIRYDSLERFFINVGMLLPSPKICNEVSSNFARGVHTGSGIEAGTAREPKTVFPIRVVEQ